MIDNTVVNDSTVVKHGAKWLLLFSALLLVLSPAVRAQAEAQETAQENIAQITGDTPQGMDVTQGPSDADDMLAPDDKNDPPSRVARISFAEGSVSMQPGGTGDWGTATKNRPVTIGDKLWTDANSRAELQAGQASIHIGDMTALSFLNLNEAIIQMRLAEGKINFRVREIRQGDVYEVDTPNLAFTVTQAGAFRVEVNENGDFTSVTVIRGQGDVSAAGQNYTLHAGERADISGTDGNVHYAASTAPEPDTLDRWAQERDLKEDNSVSARHVSRDVVGYSDLDDYGTWKEDAQYGSVWTPNNVPADWAPYSTGYWSYVNPWGYTWVDYAPWGFAPFHYGRWNYFGSYWGWCPGPIYARAFYGPAFVGFLGGGFGFGINFGFGYGHAWFPLGWGEPYRPWYRGGPGYWHGVNAHNTFIRSGNYVHTNHFNYAYAHNPRAVTAASHSAFVNGQSINRGAMRMNEASLRNTSVTNRLNAQPGRGSTFGAATAHGNVRRPNSNVENRSVVARSTPGAGASHLATRTTGMGGANRSGFSNGRSNGNAPTSFGSQSRGTSMQGMQGQGMPGQGMQGSNGNRQSQVSANRPPSSMGTSNRVNGGASINSARPGTSTRNWNAQGNSTDSGRGPQGFGSSNRPTGGSVQSTRMNDTNRPPWSRNGASGGTFNRNASQNQRSVNNNNRAPASMGGNRSYTPPSVNRGSSSPYGGNRNYNAPSNRGYSAPSNRGYTSAPSYNRGSSAPRSYSAPSAPRGYSAPRSSGGGGGSYHGGGSSGGGHSSGGGGSHGGGGGSHGGGSHR